MQHTAPQQGWQTDPHGNLIHSHPPKKSAFSPALLAVVGIAAGLVIVLGGLLGAYKLGVFGGGNNNNAVNTAGNTSPNNTGANNQTTPSVKTEMVKISGGKFTMGRNGGEVFEAPEHEAEVGDFLLDKTEVTNAEYYEFVKAKNYNPLPSHWENGRPLTNELNMPVRWVNVDDINAFIAWRSERDKVSYRLPTEEEWEYAARNGGDNNLYPWGDKWEDEKAVVRRDLVMATVGSMPSGANKWGVMDLIGNVWEWTSSPASLYKGSSPENIKKAEEQYKDYLVIRGAFNLNKESSSATSTYRTFNLKSKRDKAIGFRLARSN
jgi:formylglycine-generating enzyme required for sulfatase activity